MNKNIITNKIKYDCEILYEWAKEELEKGKRTKASKIYKAYEKSLNEYLKYKNGKWMFRI